MIDRSTLKTALAKKQDCLSLQELEQLVAAPLQQHPHLATCPRCQAEIAMLREFEENAPLPGEGAAVAWISSNLERRLDQIKNPARAARATSTSPAWFARLFSGGGAKWLMPVAALAVIAAVSVLVLRTSKQPDLNAKLGTGPTIYRSQEVEIVSPVGDISQPPKDLQWKAFPGAAKYKIDVMEVDREPLWSISTNYISLTIPAATRAKMLPGKPVLWQVTALDSQERTLAVSQVKKFSVSRKLPVSN